MVKMQTCCLCGNGSACVSHEGEVAIGFFGSVRYDTTSMIWIREAPEGLGHGSLLCDQCVDRLVEEGALEIFHSTLGAPAPAMLSNEAYRRLFLRGANRMYRDILEARGSIAEPVAGPGEAECQAIRSLRARICTDPSACISGPGPQRNEAGPKALEVGAAHATAAVLLGHAGGPDGGFGEAAVHYADAMRQRDEIWAEMIAALEQEVSSFSSAA